MSPTRISDHLVQAVDDARNLAALQAAVSRHLDDVGFSRFAFHMIRKENETDHFLALLNNYPEEWIRRYIDRQYILDDAVHNHALYTIVPFDWSSVSEQSQTRQAKTIFNEAGEFQLKTGISVPVRGLDRTFSLFSAVADGSDAERAEAVELHKGVVASLAALVHEKVTKLLELKDQAAKQAPELTPREREILQWVASGKTSADIANIVKISEATANAHVQSAMLKLNATTRTHAAVIAVLSGLIDPV